MCQLKAVGRFLLETAVKWIEDRLIELEIKRVTCSYLWEENNRNELSNRRVFQRKWRSLTRIKKIK